MNFQKALTVILGDRDKIESERHFITTISFVAFFFVGVLFVFHYFTSEKFGPVFMSGISTFIILGLYFLKLPITKERKFVFPEFFTS
jgi:hypothetical protein